MQRRQIPVDEHGSQSVARSRCVSSNDQHEHHPTNSVHFDTSTFFGWKTRRLLLHQVSEMKVVFQRAKMVVILVGLSIVPREESSFLKISMLHFVPM
jgi:hypothetical protein